MVVTQGEESGSLASLGVSESSALMGLNHAELGAFAAGMWHLPQLIADVIKYHHRPLIKPGLAEVVTVTTCADEIADLVEGNPCANPRTLLSGIRTVPPGCTPAVLSKALTLACSLRPTIEV
jgi:hypothetical protein